MAGFDDALIFAYYLHTKLWCRWNAACDSILAYGRAMFLKDTLNSPVSCLIVYSCAHYHPATGKAFTKHHHQWLGAPHMSIIDTHWVLCFVA